MCKTISTLLVSLAVMLVGMTTVSAAPSGNPFLRGVKNPSHLAELIEANLARDPSGTTMLDPEQCKRNGSCAAPVMYLESFKKHDPDAGLATVQDLPAYLRSLVMQDPPGGTFWMDCIKKTSGIYHVVSNCLVRSFKKGEKAWVNPRTGRVALASDCTNPVGRPEKPKPRCYIIPFDYRNQGDIRWDYGRARVKAHYTLSAEEYQRLEADPCFFISDYDGERKPGPVECDDICPRGYQWPPFELAHAVGIPGHKPETSFEFALRDGEGYLSLPLWALALIDTSVYCVDVYRYSVNVPGYTEWSSANRLNTVLSDEMVRTKPAGRFGRTLRGEIRY